MERQSFKKSVFGGYKKDEVNDFLMVTTQEGEKLKKIIESLEKEQTLKEEAIADLEEKLAEVELHYRELWEAYEEKKEQGRQTAEITKKLLQERSELIDKLKTVELSNDMLRKKLVRKEIGLPNEFEKQMKRRYSLDETSETETIPIVKVVTHSQLKREKKEETNNPSMENLKDTKQKEIPRKEAVSKENPHKDAYAKYMHTKEAHTKNNATRDNLQREAVHTQKANRRPISKEQTLDTITANKKTEWRQGNKKFYQKIIEQFTNV